jgi:hypothetical protein
MEHSAPPIFKAWLIFVIVGNVLGFLAGAAAGFVVALMMGAAGHRDPDEIRIACGIAGFIAGLPVSFLVFQRVINRFIVPNVWPPHRAVSPADAANAS